MSEQAPYIPSESELTQAETAMTEEEKKLSEKREHFLARIKNFEGGNPTIKGAREIGVPESELTQFALRFLEKDIREGYGLETVRSIAKQSGVVTRAEVDALFEKVKAAMETEGPSAETPEEKVQREAKWLEEMLKLCKDEEEAKK